MDGLTGYFQLQAIWCNDVHYYETCLSCTVMFLVGSNSAGDTPPAPGFRLAWGKRMYPRVSKSSGSLMSSAHATARRMITAVLFTWSFPSLAPAFHTIMIYEYFKTDDIAIKYCGAFCNTFL